tara:strand:- start:214 stop:600 length:387 start_codon:yes stop_codon:yes gene_type:complete
MRAWDDLVNDEEKSLYWTEDSDWYLDMGVKIERFHKDGRIEIKNVMTSTEKFEDVNGKFLKVFETEGWFIGCVKLNIDVHQRKLMRANELVRISISNGNERMVDIFKQRREVIQKKIHKYRNLLTKND